MAFAVPLIGAFAAAGGTIAGVGAALAGASGFAAFAGVAGGLMASAGILTGNKTLTKVGGLLGIAGAVVGAASALGAGASEAASAAGGSGVTEAASDGLTQSATESVKNEIASNTLGQGLGEPAQQAASSSGGAPLSLDAPSNNLMDQYRARLVDGSDYGVMARNAQPVQFQQTPAGAVVTDGSDYGLTARGMGSASVITDGRQAEALGKLAEAGSQIKDKTALETILGKLNGVGQWIKDNKELAQVGGQLLAGGAQAYQQGQQFDAQMNLLAQRRARLNNPVALGIQAPQLKTFTPGG